MRKTKFGWAIIALISILVVGCSDDPADVDPENEPGTIQERVNAASAGDTIFLEAGTYSDLHELTVFEGYTIQVFCEMKPGVVVRGRTGNPEDVIIDPGGLGRGFWFRDTGNCTGLADLTVRNASWAVMGIDASPWITNCIFENNGNVEENPASSGAGMYFDRSSSVITDCIFQNNEASSGGGATFSQSSVVRLDSCIFRGNHCTGSGGGLVVGNNSSATLNDCTFVDNTAGEDGAGIFSHGDSLVMFGGSMSGNTAGSRGGGFGIRSTGSGAVLNNVTIVDNVASEGSDGYVWMYSGSVNLVCCETNPENWVGDVTFNNEDCR